VICVTHGCVAPRGATPLAVAGEEQGAQPVGEHDALGVHRDQGVVLGVGEESTDQDPGLGVGQEVGGDAVRDRAVAHQVRRRSGVLTRTRARVGARVWVGVGVGVGVGV